MRTLLKRPVLVVVVFAVAAASTASAAALAPDSEQAPTFSDVPGDHRAAAAVEWAAEAGVTTGYGDGTFRPDEPLSFRHATVLLARYYEEVLGADVSDRFTRADMMMLLHAMSGGETPPARDGGEDSDHPETAAPTQPVEAVVAPSGIQRSPFHRSTEYTVRAVDEVGEATVLTPQSGLWSYDLAIVWHEANGTIGVQCQYPDSPWGCRSPAPQEGHLGTITLTADGSATFGIRCHDRSADDGDFRTFAWTLTPVEDAPAVWPPTGLLICSDARR